VNKFLKNNILKEDNDYVFINKVSGLLSVPDRFDADIPNLKAMLREHYGEIYVVHRLDRDTSGVIVFAKNEIAHKALSEHWQENKVTKNYIAITANIPPSDLGIIEAPIAEIQSKKGNYAVSNLGKAAVTHYEIKETFGEYALLDIRLETGRTHQIRVHLAYIGCPLVVDPAYGYQDAFYLSSIKKKKINLKKGMVERPLVSRTPLHACHLSFSLSGKDYSVEAPIPKDIKALRYQLEKRYGVKEDI